MPKLRRFARAITRNSFGLTAFLFNPSGSWIDDDVPIFETSLGQGSRARAGPRPGSIQPPAPRAGSNAGSIQPPTPNSGSNAGSIQAPTPNADSTAGSIQVPPPKSGSPDGRFYGQVSTPSVDRQSRSIVSIGSVVQCSNGVCRRSAEVGAHRVCGLRKI